MVSQNVSNRARLHTAKFASILTWSSVSYHTLFSGTGRSLAALQVAWANWYTAGAETGSGGSLSIKLWIEYPIGVGVRQQVTWGGASTGTISDLTTQYCDSVALNTPIPDGAKVGFWAELIPAVALVFTDAHAKSTAWGDSMNVGAGGMTASSAKPADSGGGYFGPCSIRGLTTARSLVTIGDSRLTGVGDSATAADGLNGEVGRVFGPRYAIINMGDPGALGSSFVSSHALRMALVADASYLFWEYGINDVVGGTAAAAESSAVSAKALFPATVRQARLTLLPGSTGAWTAADGSDQVTAAYDAKRRTLNATIIANPGGWDAIYDFASVNELAPAPSGKWKADGTPAKYTADGVHETTFANQQYPAAFPALL